MDLFREVTAVELEDEIVSLTMRVGGFLKDKELYFLKLMYERKFEEAISLSYEEINSGYGFLVTRLKKHLEAKDRIQSGEKIYTALNLESGW